jgi:hypothetical protein
MITLKYFCSGCSNAFDVAPCVLEYSVPEDIEKRPPHLCPFSVTGAEDANWRELPAESKESAVTSNNTSRDAIALPSLERFIKIADGVGLGPNLATNVYNAVIAQQAPVQ